MNIKHHWFWKLNYIKHNFKNFSKVILLEEDHIVTPDFLQVNSKMEKVTETRLHDTPDFIHTLGTYKYKLTSNPSDWQNLVSTSFNSGKHNMGMVFRKRFLEIGHMLKKCILCKFSGDTGSDSGQGSEANSDDTRCSYQFHMPEYLCGECLAFFVSSNFGF